jgi:RNA 2',3'-cyclic 3'-phosphodiesterase
VRWTPPENLHATLVFLGPVPEESVGDMTGALRDVAAASAPLHLQVTHAKPAPSRRPRMVWAVLAAHRGLAALAAAMHAAASPFAPGIRPPVGSSGHITLARFRAPRPELALEPLALREPSFELRHVSLVHSTLGRGGATYRTVAELPLLAATRPV